MDSEDNDFSTSEVIHSSVSEQIKRSTEPILLGVQESCALLARWNELKTVGKGKFPVLDKTARLVSPQTTGTTAVTFKLYPNKIVAIIKASAAIITWFLFVFDDIVSDKTAS